jgi:MFS family permease
MWLYRFVPWVSFDNNFAADVQIPSNMIVSKIKWPGIYIWYVMQACTRDPNLPDSGMCCAWGLVSGCTGAVTSYAGLVICRVILGFTEAAFVSCYNKGLSDGADDQFPGAIFLLSLFYEKKAMALRTAILYSGSQVGNAFGGLFALAILTLDGTNGLSGWRWLFIVGKSSLCQLVFGVNAD